MLAGCEIIFCGIIGAHSGCSNPNFRLGLVWVHFWRDALSRRGSQVSDQISSRAQSKDFQGPSPHFPHVGGPCPPSDSGSAATNYWQRVWLRGQHHVLHHHLDTKESGLLHPHFPLAGHWWWTHGFRLGNLLSTQSRAEYELCCFQLYHNFTLEN